MPVKTRRNYHKEPRDRRQFISDLFPVAKETSRRLKDKGYAFNPLVILAMAAIESDWGSNVKGNMYFEKEADAFAHAHLSKKQLLLRRRLHDSPDYRGYPVTLKILPLKDGQYKYMVKEWFKKYDEPIENFMEHFEELIGKYREVAELGCSPILFFNKLEALGYTYNKGYNVVKDFSDKAWYAFQIIDRNTDAYLTQHPERLYPHTPDESFPSS